MTANYLIVSCKLRLFLSRHNDTFNRSFMYNVDLVFPFNLLLFMTLFPFSGSIMREIDALS